MLRENSKLKYGRTRLGRRGARASMKTRDVGGNPTKLPGRLQVETLRQRSRRALKARRLMRSGFRHCEVQKGGPAGWRKSRSETAPEAGGPEFTPDQSANTFDISALDNTPLCGF